jgi:hypothetical protein
MSLDSPGWKEARDEYYRERLKQPPQPNKPAVVANNAKGTKPSLPSLDSTKASAYQIRGITWFWPGRFALGKLGLIGGLPDKGKGLISADMIARCTKGDEWPCGEGKAPKGSVIWFSAGTTSRTRLSRALCLPVPISTAFTSWGWQRMRMVRRACSTWRPICHYCAAR